MKTSINEKAIEKAIQEYLPVLIERGQLPVDLTASRSGRGWIATIQLQDEQIKDAIRASVAPMFNLSGSVSIDVALVGTRGDDGYTAHITLNQGGQSATEEKAAPKATASTRRTAAAKEVEAPNSAEAAVTGEEEVQTSAQAEAVEVAADLAPTTDTAPQREVAPATEEEASELTSGAEGSISDSNAVEVEASDGRSAEEQPAPEVTEQRGAGDGKPAGGIFAALKRPNNTPSSEG